MPAEMTPDQARTQIVADEAALQNAALLQKIADLRVQNLQLVQEVESLQRALAAKVAKETAAETDEAPAP